MRLFHIMKLILGHYIYTRDKKTDGINGLGKSYGFSYLVKTPTYPPPLPITWEKKSPYANSCHVSLTIFFVDLLSFCKTTPIAVADSGGAPNGTQFFRFRIHFCQKAPVSEVGPQREILDPPLYCLPVEL